MASIVAFQAVDRGLIPCWRSFFYCSLCKNQEIKKGVRSGIRTHAHIRGPECSHQHCWGRTCPWVWRLRPLGHPDMFILWLNNDISWEYFVRTKKCSRWGLNSQPPHILHHELLISTARWPIAPLEQANKPEKTSTQLIKNINPM